MEVQTQVQEVRVSRRIELVTRLTGSPDSYQKALLNALENGHRTIYYCPRKLRLADGSVPFCGCCGKPVDSVQVDE